MQTQKGMWLILPGSLLKEFKEKGKCMQDWEKTGNIISKQKWRENFRM